MHSGPQRQPAPCLKGKSLESAPFLQKSPICDSLATNLADNVGTGTRNTGRAHCSSRKVAPPASPATVVNADKSITFRLNYPSAKQVSVATDALLQNLAMTKSPDGVWTATTPPLVPEYYGYTFVVDGERILDPLNRNTHVNFVDLYSDILVPGTPPEPWELTDIPHGEVTRHLFTTQIGLHYPENQTAYVVYTPPGYNAKAERWISRAISVARFFRYGRGLDLDRPSQPDPGQNAG